jgi:predicted ATPase
LKISITNVGPVKRADIDLRPFVVFVGPNNSGKSVIATVLYAALSQTGVASSLRVARAMRNFTWDDISEDLSAEVDAFLEDAIRSSGQDTFRRMPESVRDFFSDRLNDSLYEYLSSVAEEVSRTAGVPLADLRRKVTTRAHNGEIKISSESPLWEVRLDIGRHATTLTIDTQASLFDVWRALPHAAWRRLSRQGTKESLPRSILLREFIGELARACFREVPLHTKYLPAVRSGIVQSRRALAGSLVRRTTLGGIENLGGPVMSGVVTDFLGELVDLQSSESGDFAEEAARLESDVLHGEIGMYGDPDTSPEVIYRTSSGEYPLGRTSSMVSELAPVVLYLRHRLRRGDLLLIEEPEAALHPGTQIAFAKCLVRLVNSGLRVVVTTHSEFFLQQVNNAIVARAASRDRVVEIGLFAERLDGKAVSAYFFSPSLSGTTVKNLSIDSEEGIPESSFGAVSEQLYNEAVALDRSIERDQGA